MDIVNCKDCYNENCKDRGVNLRTMCWAYKGRPQPQTNADSIRAMSDEELAEWLSRPPVTWVYKSKTDWLNWLKQKAE